MKTTLALLFLVAAVSAQSGFFGQTRPKINYNRNRYTPVISSGSGRYSGSSDGRYTADNSGSYNSGDGKYHPDDSGKYVHSDSKYQHLDSKYAHDADRFGKDGGNSGGSGGFGGSGPNSGFSGSFGPGGGGAGGSGGSGTSGSGSGNRGISKAIVASLTGVTGIGSKNTGGSRPSGSGFGSGSGITAGSGFGAPVALKQGSAAGLYDNRNYGIIRKIEKVENDGYYYLYETENGILAEEQGKLANKGTDAEAMKSSGFFTYTGPDSIVYTVKYTSDENGFIPEAEHLPTPPPIPAAILRALEYQRSVGTL